MYEDLKKKIPRLSIRNQKNQYATTKPVRKEPDRTKHFKTYM